jgi:hypothetical protein
MDHANDVLLTIVVGAAGIGAVAGCLGVLVWGVLAKQKKCPDCSEVLPRFRIASSTKQALKGGWSCGKCGCEIDRQGKKITKVGGR